jgi:hypothetical protein
MGQKIICTSCGFNSEQFQFTAQKVTGNPILVADSAEHPGIKCGFCGHIMLYRNYKDQIPQEVPTQPDPQPEETIDELISKMEAEGAPVRSQGEPEETINKDAYVDDYGFVDMDFGNPYPPDYPWGD